ncbi:site-specific integrase [Iamia sp. SCSIO 61187]|uniref:tyrosine-type recombinase/integrase n=1 Tax=Iamia sp. SCSIO 61187 TaxID=2722752 RepID=UPI001C62B949|nr:site-specific integrase [Iamia sp. SCSIO 61187]QYG91171.1 site-specific integrase [Iamia sp. SCSIO 61187]
MGSRRQFGNIRKMPSGRYQARYRDGAGQLIAAPSTFATKADAGRFLDQIRTDQDRGAWIDPRAGQVTLEEYAWGWLALRPDLRPRTQELYEGFLRLHILPTLGPIELGSLTPAKIRAWHATLIAAGKPGRSTIAKAYRLLSTIMRTAVEDELVIKNPCILKNAGVERPPERPIATVAQVYEIADLVSPRFRILVLLATFTGLRLGELQALKRGRVDIERGTLRVVEQTQLLKDGTLVTGPPKTDAGVRTIAIPAAILPDLAAHLEEHAAPGRDGLVIPGPGGVPFRRGTLYTEWQKVMRVVGIEGLRFHDLRHTGNTLAASTGASTKELMARMGHASPRAALIYQHATAERDRAIADALSGMIARARTTDEPM